MPGAYLGFGVRDNRDNLAETENPQMSRMNRAFPQLALTDEGVDDLTMSA
jgi:hypothetical protein